MCASWNGEVYDAGRSSVGKTGRADTTVWRVTAVCGEQVFFLYMQPELSQNRKKKSQTAQLLASSGSSAKLNELRP